jgi:hypothetical protein
MAFSASSLDILSNASLSTKVARSSASFTRRVALSHATVASRADISVASIAGMRVASTAVAISHTGVTSTSSAGMSALPLDKSCGNKTQEGSKGVEEDRGMRQDFFCFQSYLKQA